jgi:hypothetical protein
MSWRRGTVAEDHSFACLLSHDVDRPYKTYQWLVEAVRERDPSALVSLFARRNPYWTFDDVLALESDLGVRSSWYLLDEQSLFGDRPLSDLVDREAWKLYAGRYSLSDPAIQELVRRLDDGGWEVGLHGSYESYLDGDRLRAEKRRLESVLGHAVTGVRQHYLNLVRPATWQRQRRAGLAYDASPGPTDDVGFQDGYEPFRPYDDGFVVFPVTVMDVAVPDPAADWEQAWRTCEEVLLEARDNGAAASVLWHPRYFSDDFPGYTRLYRRIVERAQELGAWVGPIGDLYESMVQPTARAAEPSASDP